MKEATVKAPYLRIDRVSKNFGSFQALKSISLDIFEGEFVCFLGPSGCGKTTLLRAIAGLDIQTTGRIEQGDRDISALPPAQRDFGIVFQSYALFPNLSVADNVGYGLVNTGKRKADVQEQVRDLLTLVGLQGQEKKYPAQLSGGQQQRVALARALAPKPKVLLLDEPLSALDLKLRKEMQSELKRLQRETGITFVLVTHDQEEALAMSDRIAVMRDGLVLQVGAPKAIYDNPNSRFVADFIGEANLVPGKILGRNDALTVAVRPERVTLGRLNGHGARAKGEVAGVTFLGLDTLYEIMLDGTRVRARVRDAGEPFQPGDAVAVDWPDTAERELLH